MTKKEKRLLTVALVVFAGYFLPFKIIPGASALVKERWQQYQKVALDIERYQRLGSQREHWQEQHAAALEESAKIRAGALQGETGELIAARLLEILQQLAKQYNVQVKSSDLPEFATAAQWLLVTQSITFQADAQNCLRFLQALQEDTLHLEVVSLDLRVFRATQLNGTLKVTGFALAPATKEESNDGKTA